MATRTIRDGLLGATLAAAVLAPAASASGRTASSVGMVGLARGQASDFVLFTSTAPLQASDVLGVAQAAATHLDAGVTG